MDDFIYIYIYIYIYIEDKVSICNHTKKKKKKLIPNDFDFRLWCTNIRDIFIQKSEIIEP